MKRAPAAVNLRRRVWLAHTALLVPAAGAMLAAGCGRKAAPRGRAVPAGAAVLALGDSLTFGTGATPETSYPAVLGRLTGWQVVNAGVPGDTAAQAAERLPALLQKHRPALVLLGIGGNDLLRRLPLDTTRERIEAIGRDVLAAGAQLLLIAIPEPSIASRFTGSLSDHPMYGEIAERLKVPLHRKGWSEVLADAKLRADEIHANAAGYEKFAQGLAATAKAVGWIA